jgi:ferric-dicitrate binding protein FerR (iron transport regulator)
VSGRDPTHYARVAARLLARSVTDGSRALGDRAGSVAALEEVLRNRNRRRTVRALSYAAAAAVLLAGLGWFASSRGPGQQARFRDAAPSPRPAPTALAISLPGEPATLARAGKDVQLGSDRGSVGLSAGDRLRTGRKGRLAVSLSTGTRVDLGANGDLEVSELGSAQRFVLRGGRIHARVAKLALGERFLIDTPDVEVEVRGTSFDVVLLPSGQVCPGEAVTQVRVREGLVVVRAPEGDQHLAAGAIWQTPCGPNAAPPAPDPAPPPARARSVRSEVSASTLRAQNDLFGAALQARGRGDTAGALRLLDDLLRRYPDSPLSESARLERRELAADRP